VVGTVVALMTAFYTFRMIFMTFWGEWRGPRAIWDHVHESAWTMVGPLLVLAVPTTLAGLILGIPPEGGLVHGWLEEVFHGAEEAHAGVLPGSILASAIEHGEPHGFQLFGIGGLLLLVGASVAIAGAWLAYRWYVEQPESPQRFVERIPLGLGPGMYRASVNKYYVDDIYQLVFARGGVLIANALWWFDARVIDGAVNGAGWVARTIGGGLRRVQTGRVQNYGLGIAAGLAVVLLVYATVVR
jgi:NADH-quinone oxidoreductase subunit L